MNALTLPELPRIPDDDTIRGLAADLLLTEGPVIETGPVPGVPIVWLATNACLVQSHLPPPEGEPLVIQVVGVTDSSHWSGTVLTLD